MSEFENIQKLIQLKRFETPGEGFTEEFLREFHHRQRAQMLKQSSVQLFVERVQTWWTHLSAPKWTLATVAVTVCVSSVWLLSGSKPAPQVTSIPTAIPAVAEKPFIPKMDLSELPMANIAGRNDAKLEESLLRKHLEVRPALEGNVQALPASASGLQPPSLHNTRPVVDKKTEEDRAK